MNDSTMTTVQAKNPGPPEALELTTAPVPTPGAGQLLIKVNAAAVNFSDVMRRRASDYPFPTAFPYIPGGEVAGTVVAHGQGVTEPAIGTRVFAVVGQGGDSGYAQYAVANAQNAFAVPDGIDDHVAAGLVIAGVTAVSMLMHTARLQPGETAYVPAAAGGVGSLAVQVAKAMDAHVIAGASTAAKRAVAQDLGADEVVDSSAPDWADQLRKLRPDGVDVILEMAGGATLEQGLSALAPYGRAVVYGSAADKPRTLSQAALDRWLSNPAMNQEILAFNLGILFGFRPERAAESMQRLIGYVMHGKVRPRVGHVLPLARAVDAHRLLEERRSTGKIVLEPWPSEEPRTVDETPHYRFELLDEGRTLAFRWTEATKDLKSDEFKASLGHFADAVERYRPSGLLVDVRSFRYRGPRLDEQWRTTTIVPRYLAGGARKMAYIGIGESDANQTVEGFAERSLADETQARAWLKGGA